MEKFHWMHFFTVSYFIFGIIRHIIVTACHKKSVKKVSPLLGLGSSRRRRCIDLKCLVENSHSKSIADCTTAVAIVRKRDLN